MAINLDNIATKVMKLMQGSGLQMKMFDATSGKSVAVPAEARFFYVKEPNMMVHIDDNTQELKFHIGEDIDIDNKSVNNMMHQLKSMARTNMLDFDIRSFGKHIEPKNYAYKVEQNKEQTMNDQVNEGMGPLSGSSRTSRQTLENVRLILKHRAPVNEESRGSRSRDITAIFVETGEGERFKYPFIHLNGARAMAKHVSTGGVPHDIVGEAIVELSDNLSRLKEFMGVVNKQKLVNETNRSDVWNVKCSMNSIKETVKRIQGAKGYANFVEGIALKEEKIQEEISEEAVDTFVQKFTKSTFEESLRDIFPLLHKVNEEEMENRRTNQVDRVKEIISARDKKTDEVFNKISFGGPKDGYDYEQIKKQYAEPRSPEEATQKKIDMIAMTFDDLADRIEVDTLADKNKKKKGHDLAAELSFFLTDIANDIRKNPRSVDKEELKVAGRLLKMSKATVEKLTKSADKKWDVMVEQAFSKFDPDSVLTEDDDAKFPNREIDRFGPEDDYLGDDEKEIYWDYEDIGGNLIVNPKSTIEDQIFELLNRYHDISAMEFDPSKIEIHEEEGEEENTNMENNMNKDRLGDLAGVKRETQINEDESVFDEFVKMYKELDHEGTDEIVFGLSNHPKYRFSMANELNLDKETNRFNSYHGMTDHSGYVDIKISDLKAHMNGVAVHDNTNPIKMAGDWKTDDDVLPPEPRDTEWYPHADDYEGSDGDAIGDIDGGSDDDQVRMRHLAGIDNF